MKLTLKALKPRNPIVAPSHRRLAGAHRPRAPRQAEQRALRQELDRLRMSP